MNVMQTPPPAAAAEHTLLPQDNFRRRWRFAIAVAILGIAVAALYLLAWPRKIAAPDTLPLPALTVTIAVARHATWPTTFAASGAIAPWQEASVGAQIGSYQLTAVRANVGDEVRRGQVLAQLDPALLRAEEAQLIASTQQAEANRQRALGLRSSGGISEQDVLQFLTLARTAAAQLAAKRLQLRYTQVVAPDDGVISARSATLGAVVQPGQELFRLIRRNRLEWRGELTAPQIAQAAPGQRIELTLPDGTSATATVRVTAPSLDGQSRLGLVYADISRGSRARAGMYANGQVEIGNASATIVPAPSIVLRDGRSYLLTLADRSRTPKVVRREVTVGRRDGDQVEIVSGLSAGESVVVGGAGFLEDGDVVRVANPMADARIGR